MKQTNKQHKFLAALYESIAFLWFLPVRCVLVLIDISLGFLRCLFEVSGPSFRPAPEQTVVGAIWVNWLIALIVGITTHNLLVTVSALLLIPAALNGSLGFYKLTKEENKQ